VAHTPPGASVITMSRAPGHRPQDVRQEAEDGGDLPVVAELS
jgi:hypothetical protein